MKRTLTLCFIVFPLLVMSMGAFAQPGEPRFRVSVNGAWVQAEVDAVVQQVQINTGIFQGALLEYQSVDSDASAEGLGIGFGYAFGERWIVDFDMVPNVSSTRTVGWVITQIDPPPVTTSPVTPGLQQMDFRHRLVAISVAYAHPLSERIEVTGRFGAGWVRSEFRVVPLAAQDLLSRPDTDARVVPLAGFGARYKFEAGPEAYADFGVGTESLMTIGIGLSWRF